MNKKNRLIITPFFIADWRTPDIVYTDASTSLWACCYQSLDAALDCSSMYSQSIVSSFSCYLNRHHCDFQGRSSPRAVDNSDYPLLMIPVYKSRCLRSIADLTFPYRSRQRHLLCSCTRGLDNTSEITPYHIIPRNFVHQ